MKKNRRVTLLLVALSLLTACGDIFSSEVTVYLHLENGEATQTHKVPIGYPIKDFTTPTRINSMFSAWYYDINMTEVVDEVWISKPTHLYASYDLNQIVIEDLIETETIRAFVTVEVYNTKSTILGTELSVAQGSGVIFHQDEDGFYVLTNNHVTVKPQPGEYLQEFFILDYEHRLRYDAVRIHQLNTYDLAILRFESPKDYHVVDFSYAPLYGGRDVIAIGTPMGVYNQITFGKTLGYAEVELQDATYLSDVKFPVIVHSAEIDHGSSGGPLFDHQLELVGINFASGENSDPNNVSVAIPVDKIFAYFDEVGGQFSDIT